MKASHLALALPLLALGACTQSQEETPDQVSAKQIRFAATTERSRTGDITTNNLTQFNAYAYIDGETTPYIDNVTVSKTTENVWSYSPVAYWPSEGVLDFYAYAPEGWVPSTGPLKPIEWDNNADILPAMTDLIYAVSPNMSGATDAPNAQVVFNFRHALAKMTVRMASTSPDLTVKVSNVAIAGLNSKGNFTFPKGSTAGTPGTSTIGIWSGQNTPQTILLHISQTAQDRITLTTTPTDMGNTGLKIGGAKFIIPQILSWRSNGMGRDTYIAVMCSVYDTKTGVKLWPNENTPEENIVDGSTYGDGLLKFPLSTSAFSDFKAGNHYIYNLLINSNEEMGTINFGTPTVDTYVDVTTNYE